MPAEEKVKKKRKKMFLILAPGFLGERAIGESFLEEASMLKGKTATVNMFNLVGDIKKQQVELSFLVNEVRENKGRTSLTKFNLANSYIKRLIRRGRKRIDDSFVVKDSEGAFIRIKPLILTNGAASRAVRSSLLKNARQIILENIKKTTFENLVKEVLDYKLQKSLKQSLTKIFPIRQAEIRVAKLEPHAKKETAIAEASIKKNSEEEGEDEKEKTIEQKIKKAQQQKEKEETAEEKEDAEEGKKPSKQAKKAAPTQPEETETEKE